jgi:phosphoserine phosphatase RsbU/P
MSGIENIKNKIVVVDDDLKVTMLLDQALTKMGFQVFCANEGKKALELVKKENPILVFSDILQPGLDGVELCNRIKEDPFAGEAKVIFMTGVYNEASFKLQLHCPYDGFIEKPIDVNKLTDLVKDKINEFSLSN